MAVPAHRWRLLSPQNPCVNGASERVLRKDKDVRVIVGLWHGVGEKAHSGLTVNFLKLV